MEAASDGENYKKAKGYALRLFKLRPRSEAELEKKLAGRACPPDIVVRLIEEFKALQVIDDPAFAKVWLQGRLKKYGFRRVARELTDKGIPRECIDAVWQEIRQDHDEAAVARALLERRARLCRDLPSLKRRKRLTDYLERRGFTATVIREAVES